MIKDIYKAMFSCRRAAANSRKIGKQTLQAFESMSEHGFPSALGRVNRNIDKVMFMRNVHKGMPFEKDLTIFKSGQPIYAIATERDCDLMESTWPIKFNGLFLMRQWYERNRWGAEGPLWLYPCTKEEYEAFEVERRDLAAEQMGY